MKFQLKSSRPWYKEVVSGLLLSVLWGFFFWIIVTSVNVHISELIIGLLVVIGLLLAITIPTGLLVVGLVIVYIWATQEPDTEVEDLIRKAKSERHDGPTYGAYRYRG